MYIFTLIKSNNSKILEAVKKCQVIEVWDLKTISFIELIHLKERNVFRMMPLLWILCRTEKEILMPNIDAKSNFGKFWNYICQVRCLCVINEISWCKASQHFLQKPEFVWCLVQVLLSNWVSLHLFRNKGQTMLQNNLIQFLLLLCHLQHPLLSLWLSPSLLAHQHRYRFPCPKRQQPSAAKAAPLATAAVVLHETPRGRSKFLWIVSLSKKQEKMYLSHSCVFCLTLKFLKTLCFR